MSSRRGGGDRGAVMIEFLILVPVLVLLSLGTIEFGLAWREANRVESAVLNAGRTGATQGDARAADHEVLRSLVATFATLEHTTATKVVVYRSTGADGDVPSACTAIDPTGTGPYGISDLCNVYGAAQLDALSSAAFSGTTTCTSGSWDDRWCPTDRDRDLPDPDYLGVWVELEYDGVTGLVDGVMTIQRRAVYSLEPEIDLGASP